jgi:hypothetical protein
MSGQEKYDLLIEVTTCAGLTVQYINVISFVFVIFPLIGDKPCLYTIFRTSQADDKIVKYNDIHF